MDVPKCFQAEIVLRRVFPHVRPYVSIRMHAFEHVCGVNC